MKGIIDNEYLQMTATGLLAAVVTAVMVLSNMFYGIYIDAPQRLIGVLIVRGVILAVFVFKSAGHRRGWEGPQPTILKFIPSEVYLLGGYLLVMWLAVICSELINFHYDSYAMSLFFLWLTVLSRIIILSETAVRIKTHTLISSTLTYMCLSRIIRWYRGMKKEISYYF